MPATKAHIEATGRYEAKTYKKILLRIRNDSKGPVNYDDIVFAADQAKKSLNGYILEAVQEKIERDQKNKLDNIDWN